MANPNPTKRQNGGRREGAGRPRGSKNIYSKDSVKMMVQKYQEIQTMLDSGEIRVGSGAYAQLMATQGTLINNLMQYGYKKVPEKQEIEVENKKPVAVKLTLKEKK